MDSCRCESDATNKSTIDDNVSDRRRFVSPRHASARARARVLDAATPPRTGWRAGLKGIFFFFFFFKALESEHERPGTDEIADNL